MQCEVKMNEKHRCTVNVERKYIFNLPGFQSRTLQIHLQIHLQNRQALKWNWALAAVITTAQQDSDEAEGWRDKSHQVIDRFQINVCEYQVV